MEQLGRRWRVQECSAKIGTGVEQAFDWLLTAEASKKRKKEVEHLTADAAQIFAAFHARQVRPPGLLSSSCFSLLLTRAPFWQSHSWAQQEKEDRVRALDA